MPSHVRTIFSEKAYVLIFVFFLLSIAALYWLVLESNASGFSLFLSNYVYYDAAVSLIMGVLLAFVLTINIWSVRSRGRSLNLKKSIIFASPGMIASLLCCTPLLPSFFVFAVAFIPFLKFGPGPVQGFLAANEVYITVASIFLVTYAVFLSYNNLEKAQCSNLKSKITKEETQK